MRSDIDHDADHSVAHGGDAASPTAPAGARPRPPGGAGRNGEPRP